MSLCPQRSHHIVCASFVGVHGCWLPGGHLGGRAAPQEMNLSHSGLSGQLPGAWGGELSLPALRTLDLSGNGLQGCALLSTSPAPLLTPPVPPTLPHTAFRTTHSLCLSYPQFLSAPPTLALQLGSNMLTAPTRPCCT